MHSVEILQSVNAIGTIAFILIGSLWLKHSLKQYAG